MSIAALRFVHKLHMRREVNALTCLHAESLQEKIFMYP